MDLTKLSEPLAIEQVDFRIQSISAKGWATVLAYKDARVDMDRLDAVCGRGFWQRKHDLIDGQLFCSVGIWNPGINQWIWVQDVGTESQTEAEKGRASDSFKRACFNLGIGRELYAYPLILVQLEQDEYTVENNRGRATWNLRLRDWRWHMERDEAGITRLAARDNKGKIRFDYKRDKNAFEKSK
jgi:hypothetical protein